jgi:hypothetical protein
MNRPVGVILSGAEHAMRSAVEGRTRGLATVRAARLSICAALAMLAGCSAAQTPLAPARASAAHAIREIPAADSAKKGLYVSEFYGDAVYGFRYNNRRGKPPFCNVPGVKYVNDIAVDAQGNLIIPDGGSRTIEVFQGPAMCGQSLGAVGDPYGQPSDAASADAVNGTIVVANELDGSGTKQSAGSLSLCTLKAGCTTNLTNPKMAQVAGVALAKNGDCWASAQDTAHKAILVYFKGCSGAGRLAVGFQNQNYGGLDIDTGGRLVSVSSFDAALWVYKGCNPRCSTIGGPLPMRGLPFFGHLNEKATRFAVANESNVTVDVYYYTPRHIALLYSFSGVSASNDLGGAAYNPRSRE